MKARLSLYSVRINTLTPVLIGALLSLCMLAPAQKNAIRFQLDNDWFTDQYYSAGVDLTYHRSITNFPWGTYDQGLEERSFNWTAGYGFKIFTPNVYDEESLASMSQDRPFAGYQYIGAGLQKMSKTNKFQSYSIVIGQVGSRAGMEKIQRAAHIAAGYEPIFGWENQIANEVVVDFKYQWVKEWKIDPIIALSLHNSLQTGTSNNYIQTGINFRIGEYEEISQSGWLRPFVSQQKSSHSEKTEFFFFAGLRTKYVVSNIFLEGSLFNNPSPVIIDPKTWFFEGDLGMTLITKKLTIGLIGVFQGREFTAADGHFYINFNIAYSF